MNMTRTLFLIYTISLFCANALANANLVGPGGYIPEGCHRTLPTGSHVSHDDHEKWMECATKPTTTPGPYGDNGWDVYTGYMSKEPIISMTGKWIVPKPPKNGEGEGGTIFFFNGIEDGIHGDTATNIMQPVLQYGISRCGGEWYWALASWYVDGDHDISSCSDLIRVEEGDEILGSMTRYENGTWEITGEAIDHKFRNRTSTTLFVTPKVQNEFWPNLVLEVYGMFNCDEYPESGNTTFTENVIKTESGTVNPKWDKYVKFTDCHQGIDINQNGDVTLYY